MSVQVKVVMVGDSGVGKTSLVMKYMDPGYMVSPGKSAPTFSGMEKDTHVKRISLNEADVTLRIHDTAGEERFRAITSSMYKGADAVIVAFDVTDEETYVNAAGWIGDIRRYAPEKALRILVATKTDLVTGKRAVSQMTIDDFVSANGCSFFDTSALDGNNVEAPFEMVALRALKHRSDTVAANSPTADRKQRGVAYKKPDKNGKKDGCTLL